MTARGYAAVREAAALIDRSDRLRLLVGGAQAAQTLNGLLTNDVLSLTPGTGQYAAALTAKGKIIADVRVLARTDGFLVDTGAAAAAGLSAMIRKYVNPRLAKYADVSAVLRTVGVFGPRARTVLATVLGHSDPALSALSAYQHLRFAFEGDDVQVVRVPDLGVEGFDLFVAVELVDALIAKLAAAGATLADAAAADVARVEAGRPLWGIDMDENTLAQEANFDELHGISYTKGCYTGQETVARVHFRGHVNRALRGVRAEVPLTTRAALYTADGQECGDLRSSVVSPRLGPIALAMVRREVANGGMVTARWDDKEVRAEVVALPFA